MTIGMFEAEAPAGGTNKVKSARRSNAPLLTVTERSPSVSNRGSDTSIVRKRDGFISIENDYAFGVAAA
jgi:hypothetical protein